MAHQRMKRGHGDDMAGMSRVSRTAYQTQHGARGEPPMMGEPMADIRVSGSRVANPGSSVKAGFTVYKEKPGGRRGGRGKRVG